MSAPGSTISPAIKQVLLAIRGRINAANEAIEHNTETIAKAQHDLNQIPLQIDTAIKAGDMKQLVQVAAHMQALERKIAACVSALSHAQAELVKEQANLARNAASGH